MNLSPSGTTFSPERRQCVALTQSCGTTKIWCRVVCFQKMPKVNLRSLLLQHLSLARVGQVHAHRVTRRQNPLWRQVAISGSCSSVAPLEKPKRPNQMPRARSSLVILVSRLVKTQLGQDNATAKKTGVRIWGFGFPLRRLRKRISCQ